MAVMSRDAGVERDRDTANAQHNVSDDRRRDLRARLLPYPVSDRAR